MGTEITFTIPGQTGDRELDAIAQTVALMETLTPEARRRTVRYLDARFGSVPAPRDGF